jgi:hypothetical protein
MEDGWYCLLSVDKEKDTTQVDISQAVSEPLTMDLARRTAVPFERKRLRSSSKRTSRTSRRSTRLAMAMGPLRSEAEAEAISRTWTAADSPLGPEDELITRAARGELLAARHKLQLYSDPLAVFDPKHKLKHHVIEKTPSGELWLVALDQRDAVKGLVLPSGSS